jgi:hypothetical protein
MEGGLTDELGGGQLDRAFVQQLLNRRAQRGASGGGDQTVIEPIIRPKFQHMGASSARWTRHAERSRDLDNTRRAARESHTDVGFA